MEQDRKNRIDALDSQQMDVYLGKNIIETSKSILRKLFMGYYKHDQPKKLQSHQKYAVPTVYTKKCFELTEERFNSQKMLHIYKCFKYSNFHE